MRTIKVTKLTVKELVGNRSQELQQAVVHPEQFIKENNIIITDMDEFLHSLEVQLKFNNTLYDGLLVERL